MNPSTKATGALITAAVWNQDVVANTEFLAKPPSCRVQNSTEQSIPNSGQRSISWASESWDTDTMWSSTAPTRIDINTAGKYLVTAFVVWGGSTNSTGGTVREIGLVVDGTTTATPNRATSYVQPPRTTGINVRHVLSDVLSFTATQFIRLQAFQDSGAALNVNHTTGAGADIASLTVTWISS